MQACAPLRVHTHTHTENEKKHTLCDRFITFGACLKFELCLEIDEKYSIYPPESFCCAAKTPLYVYTARTRIHIIICAVYNGRVYVCEGRA